MAFQQLDSEQLDDYKIYDTDLLVVAGRIVVYDNQEKQYSSLEIYVYQPHKKNIYVHHQISLSAFPLAIEWLPINPSSIEKSSAAKGNYAIVASFLPEIQIWNLDYVNSVQPSFRLGGYQSPKKGVKKFKKNKQKLKQGSHQSQVISLSLNDTHKNLLASGSADRSIKIWDLQKLQNIQTYDLHKDKVVITKWNPSQPNILMSISNDKIINIFDTRNPKSSTFEVLPQSISAASWHISKPELTLASQDGNLAYVDARNFKKPIWSINAHNKEITGVQIVKKLVATCSEDQKIKIWSENGQLIKEKKPKGCGELFCLQFSKDQQLTLSAGNSKGQIFIWDLLQSKQIVQHLK